MASEDVKTSASAVIVNFAEEAKVAKEEIKPTKSQVYSICKSLVAGGLSVPVFDQDLVEDVHDEEPDEGSYSPQLFHGDENEENAIHLEEDKTILERRQIAVKEELCVEELASRPTTPADNFERNALKAMGDMKEGDAVFGSNNEINLDPQGARLLRRREYKATQLYWWLDRYRPTKPKYFNRVHTGYEWNKYNRTHFDHDNPPPKIVQGYKFNIFYPDLVDESVAPTYTITNDGDSSETCIIRFHAGAPYEDIAFRIVNKELEYSHKKGFKCTFERGVLHVYFDFKRYRQRRIQD